MACSRAGTQIPIAHGAAVDLEHAASLGSLDRSTRNGSAGFGGFQLAALHALISGAAVRESPLRVAKRRNRTEIVSCLLKHGPVDEPPVRFG
jgi:hypothetical protein